VAKQEDFSSFIFPAEKRNSWVHAYPCSSSLRHSGMLKLFCMKRQTHGLGLSAMQELIYHRQAAYLLVL